MLRSASADDDHDDNDDDDDDNDDDDDKLHRETRWHSSWVCISRQSWLLRERFASVLGLF